MKNFNGNVVSIQTKASKIASVVREAMGCDRTDEVRAIRRFCHSVADNAVKQGKQNDWPLHNRIKKALRCSNNELLKKTADWASFSEDVLGISSVSPVLMKKMREKRNRIQRIGRELWKNGKYGEAKAVQADLKLSHKDFIAKHFGENTASPTPTQRVVPMGELSLVELVEAENWLPEDCRDKGALFHYSGEVVDDESGDYSHVKCLQEDPWVDDDAVTDAASQLIGWEVITARQCFQHRRIDGYNRYIERENLFAAVAGQTHQQSLAKTA
jgi:hypothetical protein